MKFQEIYNYLSTTQGPTYFILYYFLLEITKVVVGNVFLFIDDLSDRRLLQTCLCQDIFLQIVIHIITNVLQTVLTL